MYQTSAFISVTDIRRACLASVPGTEEQRNLSRSFDPPSFFLEYNRLSFYTGVDKQTWSPCFLLNTPSAQQLVQELQRKHTCSLQHALQVIAAAAQDGIKYDSIQPVSIPTEAMYKAITKSFAKIAKQSKSQALYSECRQMLVDASIMAQPLNARSTNGSSRSLPVHMFLSLDFEWWERSQEVILEVGWSLWDTLSQRHRTRHWVIKENLNKSNGRFISDNRMRFSFGTSGRGSLDKAMTALQEEVDAQGITEGLTLQQKQALERSGVVLVLVGHGMTQDMEQAALCEIEWPEDVTIFDTQKLYMAWQLKQLDAAAAAKALEAVVLAEGKKDSSASKPGTAELPLAPQDLLRVCDDHELESDDDRDWVECALDDEYAAQQGASAAANDSDSAAAAGVKGGKIVKNAKGKRQVQNPAKVRPWPAGPPSSNDNKQADADQAAGGGGGTKVDHQVSLTNLLAALGIKPSKLHNAGNDARYTMEAFLALVGHPVCADPAAAHLASISQDASYQQELEASMQAAAAQGWGTPSPTPGSVSNSRKGSGAANRQQQQHRGTAGSWNSANSPVAGANYRGAAAGLGAWSNSHVSSTASSECGSLSEADCHPGQPADPAAAAASRAPPPGFSGPPQFPAHHSASQQQQRQHPSVPPGFAPKAAARPVWGGTAARALAEVAAQKPAGAWGERAAATKGVAAAAGPAPAAASNGKPAWGNSAPGMAAAPAAAAASPPAGEWGTQQKQKQQPGYSAWNSTVDTGSASKPYDPNPDGW